LRRSARFLTAFLAAAAALAAGRARAGIPDWMKAAGSQQLPAYPDETVAVMLLDEQVTSVKDNGETDTVYRRVYKILRTEGRDYGKVFVYFDSETRLTYLKGWSLSASGQEYEVKEKETVEITPFSDELFRDTHLKVLLLPAAEPGSLIGFEYQQRRRPLILQDFWPFQLPIPVRHARFTINLPKGWGIQVYWRNHPPAEGRPSGPEHWAWDLENIPGIEEERGMPAWSVLAGRMTISFLPPGSDQRERALNSWDDVGRWYASLAGDRRKTTPEIHQKAMELTARSSTWLEKVGAIASYVQTSIRYVAIEIGIGGYQPHPAGNIYADKYGDCKDKVTLLGALLAENGVKSYYVLVNTTRGAVARDIPSALGFDHVIAAIPLPPEVDPARLPAAIYDARLGNLLLFDPTDSRTPLGSLPPYEQASQVLLVYDDGGAVITTPLAPPTDNRLLRQGTLKLTADGTLSGEVRELRRGAEAIHLKRMLTNAKGADRPKILEDYLGGSLAGFSMQNPRVEGLDTPGDTLTLEYGLSVEGFAQQAGDLLLVRARVIGVKSEDALERKERKYPLEFEYASTQGDFYEIELPAGYALEELPGTQDARAPGFSYHSDLALSGNVLTYRRVYERKEVDFPVSQSDELKKFFRQVSSDERSLAVLKRTALAAPTGPTR